MKALVLSAETPSACAVVRGLHAAGFEVVVLGSDQSAWSEPTTALAKLLGRPA